MNKLMLFCKILVQIVEKTRNFYLIIFPRQ